MATEGRAEAKTTTEGCLRFANLAIGAVVDELEPVCMELLALVDDVAVVGLAELEGGGGVGAVYLTLVGGFNLEDTLGGGGGAFFASSNSKRPETLD